ncbi:hypothetical protein [Streptomyces prasinus]|uniref:hypothetical protein n=1 Tax=Streptomyces prasinus TaxID=67345 RepID=UPI0007C7AD16|nr:hypothetical protein [Streptomyces prasinus]
MIAVVAVVLVGALGALYLLKVPPFEEDTGDIEASSVCDSLGQGSQSVGALRSVLPEKSSYAFDDDVNLRMDEQDSSYRSDCFVSGDGDQLLSARTEMIRDEPFQNWVDSEVTQHSERDDHLTPFATGPKGTALPSVAAFFMPCTSPGNIPGGQYNLSVVVHLKKAGTASATDTRASLIELAKNAAKYAHTKARCDISLS